MIEAVRGFVRTIWEALPGTSTAAGRMYRGARSQQAWHRVPMAQRHQAFLQHQVALKNLQLLHHGAKLLPPVIDWLFRVTLSEKFWSIVFTILFVGWLFGVKWWP